MNLSSKTLRLLSIVPAIAGLVAASGVRADQLPTFNTYQNDNEFLTGRNITTNQSAFTDPVHANGGEDVEVAVYYHNTGGDQATGVGSVAHNTTVKVSIPTNNDLTHLVTGSIVADGMAAPVTGTIVNGVEVGKAGLTINSDSKTTVSFVAGSVRWFPEEMTQSGQGANLPNGVNGDTIATTGLNIGDIAYCWAHSGYIHFKIHVTGSVISTPTPTPTPPTPVLPTLKVEKDVRKAPSTDTFVDSTTANPGNELEYSITVRNEDGSVAATNVKLVDQLPAGLTYVGPTVLHLSNGTTSTLPDGIVNGGIVVVPSLKASDSVQVTFLVNSSTSIANNACLTNTVTASATNGANQPTDTAKACFLIMSTPTPSPVSTPTPVPATPTPTPVKTLPVTGPEDSMVLGGLSGLGAFGAVVRGVVAKRNLKKSLRNLDIL